MALAVIGLTAFVLGGARSVLPEPRVTPSVDTYWLQHLYDTGQVRAVQSGSTAPAGPASPSTQPGSKSAGSWSGLPATPALRGAFATVGSYARAAIPTLIMPTPPSTPATPTASASAGPTPTGPALTMYGPSRPGPTASSAIP